MTEEMALVFENELSVTLIFCKFGWCKDCKVPLVSWNTCAV